MIKKEEMTTDKLVEAFNKDEYLKERIEEAFNKDEYLKERTEKVAKIRRIQFVPKNPLPENIWGSDGVQYFYIF